MKIRYTPRSVGDLASIFAYIAKENPAAARRVVDRIEAVVAHLEHAPEAGTPTNKPGIRRLPVVSYPYLIFYEVFAGEVVIVHIRHGARRPWVGPLTGRP